MKISYDLYNDKYSYEQSNFDEVEKLNFLLTNNKGDFLNVGAEMNVCKFQGLNVCNPKTMGIFKFLDEIVVKGLEVEEITYGGYIIKRKFKSSLLEFLKIPVVEQISEDSTFGEEGKLKYNDEGMLEEVIEEKVEVNAEDKFYLGPTGGIIYDIRNFEGEIFIDLDCRKSDDFDEWGRNYRVYKNNSVVFVEYVKKSGSGESYKLYMGIKAVNFSYDLLEEWVKKDYMYSKQRNSSSIRYVYRLMKVNVTDEKSIIFGAGFSEEEVVEQIFLLEQHQRELENFDESIFKDLVLEKSFEKPLNQDVNVAYKLSNNAIFRFLNKQFSSNDVFRQRFFAGFPWFAQAWTRDELVGLRAFINNGEESLVKEILFDYIDKIDVESGLLKRLDAKGSLESGDGVFWLAKRFEDFIFYLDAKQRLEEVFTEGELEYVYKKFSLAFNNMIKNYWDKDNELFRVKKGDSWMDTLEVVFPLDVEVQFLNFVSVLAIFAGMLAKKEEAEDYLDFENLLREKIRAEYYRQGMLFNEPFKDILTSNVFLAYYFYPDLFFGDEWETIFDNALKELRTSWGGFSSLSRKDSSFEPNYTGENDKSYHHGDSWFWINNIVAIVFNDLNEQKYRALIREILLSSTNDILKMGTVGFASELSSSSVQKAEGSLAQFWSSSTYVEMVDMLFKRKN